MQLNLLSLSPEQEATAISTIQPWLSALREPYTSLSVPYGLPVWVLNLYIDQDRSYLVSQSLTNPYSSFFVKDMGQPFAYYFTNDGPNPLNLSVDSTVVTNMQAALNYASGINSSLVVNPRFLIIPGQFKFLWLYEYDYVLCIEKSIKNVGTFMSINVPYRYSDMIQMITSNLLGLGI